MMAFGHDVYLYFGEGEKRYFELASLGYIWVSYFPGNYEQLSETLTPENWKLVTQILEYEATYLALAFAGILYAIRFMLGMFGLVDIRPEHIQRKIKKRADNIDELEKVAAKKRKYLGFRRNR